jgi:hypothetical protein
VSSVPRDIDTRAGCLELNVSAEKPVDLDRIVRTSSQVRYCGFTVRNEIETVKVGHGFNE